MAPEKPAPAETDLALMLATLEVERLPGAFVYVSVPAGEAPDAHLQPQAVVHEAEGTTLVLRQIDAGQRGLAHDGTWAWLSLTVRSSLEAVGLTAAVSAALAASGIPANVMAGFHHDHVLVPEAKAGAAIDVLHRLRTPPRPEAAQDPPVT